VDHLVAPRQAKARAATFSATLIIDGGGGVRAGAIRTDGALQAGAILATKTAPFLRQCR